MGRQGTPRTDASRASLAHRVGAYVSAHRLRRRWLALMGVLAAVVVVVTAGALTMPASTMTADVATLPEGASVPEGYTQQYTAKDEANGITVTAYAPEGVVPEGATLKASLLAQDSDEYVAAKQATGATDEEGAGFAAMDISFVDVDGNEVEPTGDVYVNIDAAGILPEDADPESVVVQHLAEDESGAVASVDTVADVADQTEGVAAVATDDATSFQAAFSTDNFSIFTIYWSSKSSLNIQIIDTEGNAIGGSSRIGYDQITEATSINDIVVMVAAQDEDKVLDGYEFNRAEVAWGANDAVNSTNEVQKIRYKSSRYGGAWQYSTSLSGDSWTDFDSYGPSTQTLYLIYDKKDSGVPDIPDVPSAGDVDVTTGKSADRRGDGSYDLTLSVSGDRGSKSDKQAVDVLFVLDVSGSMDDNWGSSGRWDPGEKKLTSAKNAIDRISGYGDNEGLSDNAALDVQYALVTFSGSSGGWYDDANTARSWTDSVDALHRSASNLRASGGTNYEAGLRGARELDWARDDAQRVVIFVSDGNPGYYYTSNGGTTGEGSPSTYNQTALDHAETEAGKLTCDYFYFVGVTDSLSKDVSDGLVGASTAPSANKGTYMTNDADELLEAFDNIQQRLTFVDARDVTMVDQLSGWAQLVPASDGQAAYDFTLRLEKRADVNSDYETAGQSVTVSVAPDGTSREVTLADDGGQTVKLTVSLDSDAKTITVDFEDGYSLAQNYRYVVTTRIEPTDDAVRAGEGSYNDMGQVGTGTHAGELGFFSNDEDTAYVEFTPIATDDEGNETPGAHTTVPFPKPVIQVPVTGSLTINKDVEGATLSSAHSYGFTITTTTDMTNAHATYGDNVTPLNFYKDDNDNIWSASLSVSASNADDGEHNGSVTISGLPVGEYAVMESTSDGSVELANYEFDEATYSSRDAASDSPDTNGDVTVSDSQTAEVTVTNKYTAHQLLTVHKTSDQDGAPLEGASFKLYRFVLGPDGEPTENKEYYTESTTADVTTVSWEAETSATVKTSVADGNLTFSDLDTSQTYYLVETSAPDGYVQLDKEIAIFWNRDEDCWTAQYVGGGDDLFDSATDEVIVTNSTGMALPSTGGSGTTIGTIGGVILVAAAVCGYGLGRSRERRGAQS